MHAPESGSALPAAGLGGELEPAQGELGQASLEHPLNLMPLSLPPCPPDVALPSFHKLCGSERSLPLGCCRSPGAPGAVR